MDQRAPFLHQAKVFIEFAGVLLRDVVSDAIHSSGRGAM